MTIEGSLNPLHVLVFRQLRVRRSEDDTDVVDELDFYRRVAETLRNLGLKAEFGAPSSDLQLGKVHPAPGQVKHVVYARKDRPNWEAAWAYLHVGSCSVVQDFNGVGYYTELNRVPFAPPSRPSQPGPRRSDRYHDSV